MVATMERTGHKKTDVGLIPDDWQLKQLRKVALFRRGSFPQPYGLPKWYDEQNGMPFVQVFDVDVNMKLKSDTKQKISEAAKDKSVFVEKGSIVLTIQGSIGRIAITQYDAYVDRTLLIFTSFLIPLDKWYFMYIVYQLFQIEKQKAPGGTIKTITKEELSSFQIPLPPTKAEQTAIATALNDADALIIQLEKLIAKKRALKQGIMQELLTGKKRLPEFSGEWDLQTIDMIASPCSAKKHCSRGFTCADLFKASRLCRFIEIFQEPNLQ
jgi:type I restriction enzyme S subunit